MQLDRSTPLPDAADDQIQPLINIVAAIIIPFLVVAFVILYFFLG